jgi:Regulator of chromosome condensation (RCC1) repeat
MAAIAAVAWVGCGSRTGLQAFPPPFGGDGGLDGSTDGPFFGDGNEDADGPVFADANSTLARGIAVGPLFACVVLASGAVQCWGAVYIGNPPIPMMCGTQSCFTTPVPMPGFSEAVAVAAGDGYFCAIIAQDGRSVGTVECLGDNTASQLGLGNLNTAATITAARVTSLSGATAIALGGRHSCVILGEKASGPAGSVQCWGDNVYGELGGGYPGPDQCETGACSVSPIPVKGLSNVVTIAAGAEHTCALLTDGTVSCWGDNAYGELGNGTSSGPSTCGKTPCATSPVMVPNLSGVVAIAAGGNHTCAALSDGSVKCWGRNDSSELGLGVTSGPESCADGTYCSTSPTSVLGLGGVVDLALGDSHSCAVLKDRSVQCWGIAAAGELGNGSSKGPEQCDVPHTPPIVCSTKPVPVTALSGVVHLAAGSVSSCAIRSDGAIDCWGDNTLGELGDGTSMGPNECAGMACSTTPVPVEL